MIHKVKFVAERQGKILVVRYGGEDCYSLPGGQVRRKEPTEDALVRNVKTDVVSGIVGVRYETQLIYTNSHGRRVFVDLYCGQFESEPRAGKFVKEVKWFDRSDIRRHGKSPSLTRIYPLMERMRLT